MWLRTGSTAGPKQRRSAPGGIAVLLTLLCGAIFVYYALHRTATSSDSSALGASVQGPLKEVEGMTAVERWHWRNELLRVTIPDAVGLVPDQLRSDIRNPCWTPNVTTATVAARGEDWLACLPFFYVLGSFQCGWADLYSKILQHPHVVSSKPRGNTGTNFYFEKRPWDSFIGPLSRDAGLVMKEPDKNIIGEASGGSLTFTWTHSERLHRAFDEEMRRCWRHCKETIEPYDEQRRCIDVGCYKSSQEAHRAEWALLGPLTLPALVYAVHGDAHKLRLLSILRNPADRLWASFVVYGHYAKHYGDGEEGFLKWFREAANEFGRCSEEYSLRHCALYFESLSKRNEQVFYHCDQLIKGMYSVFVEDWLAFFPDGQLLVIQFEEYIQHPTPALARVFDHLGLDDLPSDALKTIANSRSALEIGDDPRIGRSLSAQTRLEVESFYAPFNAKLAQQLRDPRFLWR